MKRVRIADIIPPLLHKDVMSSVLYENHFHILLHQSIENRGMLIGVDKSEAMPLAMTLRNLKFDRREIYQLTHSLISDMDMKTEGVYISGNVENGALETKVRFRKGKEKFEYSCRPGDAFILATESKCPIYIVNEILEKFSFSIPTKYRNRNMTEKGLEDLISSTQKMMNDYENDFIDMSKKASTKSIEAYAQSSKEVMDYVFGKI